MTTSKLASIENKPQNQQQLHGGKNIWSHKKLYMTFAIKLYFIFWNGLYFGHNLLRKLKALFVFALLSSIGQLL